ncbi:efflux RND transporter periplasmic adaptor subunit [Thermohalobacter berrensis]|uniref:Membrane fusion protein biotin-lipoyl like domain-containing protein n=1 Tax=Thermohalobacter berrensis TaxID=99594 RepID=A0A419T3G4_9FIRM|nr:hypothetical protein [Thermohalobacter berrensis]RKD31953.1 hypothetical protein BET03_11775 [Thermohalobacter berrensis]
MESKVLKISKNTIITFFTLVFILGFFSKSVVNLFIPKVQVTTPVKSTFSRTLNIKGKIVPKEKVKIRLAGSVIVEDYFVKIGEKVEKGDPLLKINKNYGVKSSYKDIDELKIDLKKEKFKLERLQNTTYNIDKMNVQLLEEKMKNMKEEIKKLEKLYKAGAITANKLHVKKQNLKSLEINLKKEKLMLQEKRKENQLEIQETLGNIENLETEISEAKNAKNFYYEISSDGICYSDVDGIVLNTNDTEVILPQDTVLIELGLVKNFNSVKFVTKIPEKYYNFISDADMIKINSQNDKMPDQVNITEVSKVINNKMIKIEGEFLNDNNSFPIINKEIKGIIEKKYVGEKTVPKIAVIPHDKFEAGKKGHVYIVLEEKGALGTEYIVKRVNITIKDVGDDVVSIDGIDMYDNPKIVINPSFKIRDGVKVRIWE